MDTIGKSCRVVFQAPFDGVPFFEKSSHVFLDATAPLVQIPENAVLVDGDVVLVDGEMVTY